MAGRWIGAFVWFVCLVGWFVCFLHVVLSLTFHLHEDIETELFFELRIA